MGVFIQCKLVSACSGPILLIMEFAQHGSLRTYLHKCRGQRGQEEEHHQVPVIIIIFIIITIIIIIVISRSPLGTSSASAGRWPGAWSTSATRRSVRLSTKFRGRFHNIRRRHLFLHSVLKKSENASKRFQQGSLLKIL